ncbi:hypothetical protein YWIDRAFT_01091 [Streptomyces sp. SceaMP-e96]|uniref:hypothetical protein n=1 Tax=unclassified Streptomyces TaxID=2593676 RepID=UPI000823C264|nr:MULTISPECIES: hypothetical protein [unclassified Streptomyces]SCK12666.1 hypothetical protein YWIDRAFT_01091 [Streptomyces sp. SceaMP-e96]
MTPSRRTGRRTAAVVALTLAAAGCGIRGTSVPVDAGRAPSRVSCKAPASDPAPNPPGGAQATVYLVCGSALAQVERTVSLPKNTAGSEPRLPTARALLKELQRQPSHDEDRAGFSSALPQDLKVTAPRAGDPADALRLSIRPDDLPSFALAQLVCTYGASPALGRTHAAVLGGPGEDAAHRYECSAEVLANPDIAENTGWGDPLSEEG